MKFMFTGPTAKTPRDRPGDEKIYIKIKIKALLLFINKTYFHLEEEDDEDPTLALPLRDVYAALALCISHVRKRWWHLPNSSLAVHPSLPSIFIFFNLPFPSSRLALFYIGTALLSLGRLDVLGDSPGGGGIL